MLPIPPNPPPDVLQSAVQAVCDALRTHPETPCKSVIGEFRWREFRELVLQSDELSLCLEEEWQALVSQRLAQAKQAGRTFDLIGVLYEFAERLIDWAAQRQEIRALDYDAWVRGQMEALLTREAPWPK